MACARMATAIAPRVHKKLLIRAHAARLVGARSKSEPAPPRAYARTVALM